MQRRVLSNMRARGSRVLPNMRARGARAAQSLQFDSTQCFRQRCSSPNMMMWSSSLRKDGPSPKNLTFNASFVAVCSVSLGDCSWESLRGEGLWSFWSLLKLSLCHNAQPRDMQPHNYSWCCHLLSESGTERRALALGSCARVTDRHCRALQRTHTTIHFMQYGETAFWSWDSFLLWFLDCQTVVKTMDLRALASFFSFSWLHSFFSWNWFLSVLTINNQPQEINQEPSPNQKK